jgi:hypothetical protein
VIEIKVAAFCLFMSSNEIVFVKNGIQRYIEDKVHQIRQTYTCFKKIFRHHKEIGGFSPRFKNFKKKFLVCIDENPDPDFVSPREHARVRFACLLITLLPSFCFCPPF